MDRRRFLRLFSAASLAAIAPPHLLGAVRGERFVSQALGVSFAIPTGWHRPTTEEIVRNLARQTFTDEALSDEAFAPRPVVAVYQHPEPHPEMNPGVWLYADAFDAWMESPLVFARDYADSMMEMVEDGRIAEPARPVVLGGIEGAEVTIAYRAVIEEDDFECPVIDRTRVFVHRGHLIVLLAEQSQDGRARADAAFASLDASLQFA